MLWGGEELKGRVRHSVLKTLTPEARSQGSSPAGHRLILCLVCVLSRSVMSDSFVTLWTVARQAPLSMGILQERILEWAAFPFSWGSSQPRDWPQVSHIAGRFFTAWATRKAWNVCVPPKFVYCNPHSSVMILGDGAFERRLGREGRVLMNGTGDLIKDLREFSCSLAVWDHSEKMVCEPGSGAHQTLNLLVPWSGTSQPPELWETHLLFESPAHSRLSRQRHQGPTKMETGVMQLEAKAHHQGLPAATGS